MPRKSEREPRESSLASGWTVEGVEAPAGPPAEAPAEALAAEVPVAAIPDGWTSDDGTPEAAPVQRAQLSTGALVLLGVVGGLYLVYSWIWFSWAQYTVAVVGADLSLASGSLGAALQLALYWLAPLAPALWFITVLVLGRSGRTWKLALWLLIGAVLLAPLPYFLWGA